MNPLEQHPYLFANGKFRAKFNKNFENDRIRKLYGIRRTERDWVIVETFGEGSNWASFELEFCTLIARPIEDMTDEECNKFLKKPYPNKELYNTMRDDWAKNLAGNDRFSPSQFLGLLSIGVYPFDQSHFKDGTVIDIRTL